MAAPARWRLALFSRRRLAAVGDGESKLAPRLSNERRDLSSWCTCREPPPPPAPERRPEDPRCGVRLLAASPEGADGVEVEEEEVVVAVAIMAWAWMLEEECRRAAASRGVYDTRSGPFCTAGSLIVVVVAVAEVAVAEVAVAGATSTVPVGVSDRE